MAYRKLPFGYKMQLGSIEINEGEAALVREIFERYIAGASYQQIAEELNAQPLPFRDAGVPWNKNMIGRILSDRRYLGEKGFPALVELTLFEQAEACRPQPVEWPNETVLCVRRLGRCAHCGETPKYHGSERWSCPCCSVSGKIPDLTKQVFALLPTASDRLQVPEMQPQEPFRLAALHSELDKLLKKQPCDEDTAKALVYRIATAEYDQIGSAEYETQRLKRLFETAEPCKKPDVQYIKETIAAVLVNRDGGISIRLKNGQIIERNE